MQTAQLLVRASAALSCAPQPIVGAPLAPHSFAPLLFASARRHLHRWVLGSMEVTAGRSVSLHTAGLVGLARPGEAFAPG